ncbi:MAG: formyltransferase family protein [Planctomycetota bacterium]
MPDALTPSVFTPSVFTQAVFTQAVVLGGGRIACDCLTALADAGLPVHAIHNDSSPFSLLHRAANRPACSWQKLSKPQALTRYFLEIQAPTLVVSANNAWIVPAIVLQNPALRFINYHNSLLPRHRGRNAPSWAIYCGDQYTGATWHLIDSGIDTGPIIAQQRVPITPVSTALQLVAECMRAATSLFHQFLPRLLTWSLSSIPPMHSQTEYHAGRDVPARGLLDPDWPLPRISRLLRALDYGPLDILPKPRLLLPQLPDCQAPVIARYSIRNALCQIPVPPVPGCSPHLIQRPDASIVLWLAPPPVSPCTTPEKFTP